MSEPLPPSDVRQVIVMRTDLNMRKGKMIAQGAHAGAMVLQRIYLDGWTPHLDGRLFIQWLAEGHTRICVGVGSAAELHAVAIEAARQGLPVYTVVDEGLTEVAPDTPTCCAVGPATREQLHPVTGHLKLL